MRPHEFVTMGAWRIKFCGDGTGTYCCNCPPWRYQTTPTNKRTCKHLQLHLGAAFEAKRCAPDLDEFVDGAGIGYGAGAAAAAAAPAIGGAAPRAMAGAAFGAKKAIPGVLLAQKADEKGDYTGWWCSEKLDGVRGYWDGTTLVSRNGGVFHAPEWFTRSLPKDCTFDGEIFGGRKQFQRTVGVVRSGPGHVGWKNLTFQVFDIPSEGRVPFERRMEIVKQKILANLPPELAATAEARGGAVPAAHHVQLVAQEKCTSKADLDRRLRTVEAAGGEGLMLRQPGSAYVHARSSTLLKVKSFEEVEAIVRGYDTGKGRLAGAVGALRAELANGKQFAVGSGLTDSLRARPPRIGAIITVKFQELTDAGIPRFPVFIGERIDAVWPPPAAARVVPH
jgi:DNA ligase-1